MSLPIFDFSGSSDGTEPPDRVRVILAALIAVVLGAAVLAILAIGGGVPDPGPSPSPSTEPSTSPEPSTSASPEPSVSPEPSTSVEPSPTEPVWPATDTTGVPAGTTLTAHGGNLVVRTAGTVVDALDITGCVRVEAADVTIKRTRIRCNSTTYGIYAPSGVRGLTIEDVEIDGMGTVAVGICCGHYTARRVNVYGSVDGVRLGDGTTVEDSIIHSLARPVGSHSDTAQTTGGIGISLRHNTLLPYNASTGDLANACLMVGSEQAPGVIDLVVEDNYCNGGNWSIGVRTDLVASGVVFRRNHFGRDYRYGIIARPTQAGVLWEPSNVWADTGQAIIG